VYSHDYAFNPGKNLSPNMVSWNERPDIHEDDREMFLTKLLVGNEIWIDRKESPSKKVECRSLIVPPTNPITGLRYDTVTGITRDSRVWIVYENGRAYPEYLVRYYRGPKRVTFAVKSSDYQSGSSDLEYKSQDQACYKIERNIQDKVSFNTLRSQEKKSQNKESIMRHQYSVTKQVNDLDYEIPPHLHRRLDMESLLKEHLNIDKEIDVKSLLLELT
jgi:hypothetical protein